MYQCVRTRACVGVNGRGGGGVSVRVCMCVYMVAILKVSRLAEKERERESQVCVYSHVARYKGVASSWSVLVNEETINSSMC